MQKLGNILILGDSYSTFKGYNPEGYAYWYGNEEHINETDVKSAEECWWSLLEKEVEGKIILNESHSGATVCNTERPTIPGTSFIIRADRLIESGFFNENKIDTVLILGGTNDSWIDSPIGEFVYDGFNEENKKDILPAFAYLLTRLKEAAPDAKILAIINCDLKDAVMGGFEEISEKLGIPSLRLKNISKLNGHPSVEGMIQIKDQVLDFLK
jgi:hypothetical protein